ncbi:MAG: hypothetical protein HOE80_03270 [Candidatus Magasanikbacteria bacterium]|jgi:tRNA A37 threonylcarbamoyladenosine modification protein TsaB|nr:hypothetical protein [Candidatus Magasanikbacteria bacterium]MBT4071717.1 hypothetical protein [Candidatus Magasanikbacteria bacterium]
MHIIIDSSKKDIIRVGECGNDLEEYAYKNRDILQAVHEYLESQKKTKKDVSGIAVVIGSGSFTATRLAVTLANTWGYVLDIPVMGVSLEDIDHPKRIIFALEAHPKGQYISATYSGMPHIGPPKNSVVQ